MTPTPQPRPQVPLDKVTAEDVRKVRRRISQREQYPVAKFGSAI